MRNSTYRPDIDGLRAIAVSLVLLFHVGFQFLPGGFVGVDVFFVISGFLITSLLVSEVRDSSTISFAGFYQRRIRRLAPALLVTILITLLSGLFLLSPEDWSDVSESVIYAVSGLSNFYFYVDGDYWNSEKLRPLLHTWSLGVEEQFYLVWPGLILLLYKRYKDLGLRIGIIVLILFSFICNVFFPIDDSALYYLTHFRFFELGLGAALALFLKNGVSSSRLSTLLSITGLACIGYSAASLTKHSVFPSYNALLPAFGTLLIIASNANALVNKLISSRIFVWVGLRSYSLYLVHWPIIAYVNYLNLGNINIYIQATIILLSLVASDLMYRFVEQPFRSKKGVLSGASFSSLAASSLAVSLVLVIVSSTVQVGKGWPWRLGQERLEMISDLQKHSGKAYDAFTAVESGGTKCKSQVCSFPDEDSPKEFVLLGRSHAQHYINGLVDQNQAFTFYWLNCNSMLDEYCDKGKWATTEQKEYRDKVLQDIKANNYPLVVISEVLRYSRDAGVKNIITGEEISFQGDDDWIAFMEKSLLQLKNSLKGQEILLIGETPRRGAAINSISCITRPIMPDDCFSTPMESHQKWINLNNRLEKISKKIGIHFFNPHEVLCNKNGCKNFLDGRPVYFDSHHYSDMGSSIMAPALVAEVNEILSQNGIAKADSTQ